MRNRSVFLLLPILVVIGSCSRGKPGDMIFVEGGQFLNTKSIMYGKNVTVTGFYIGAHETTQDEWIEVMGSNPSGFKGGNLPVESVSWYDCIEFCNKKSAKEGLNPYYNIDKNNKDPDNSNEIDDVKWTVTINKGADGYRLPTEPEWEYAAGGGRLSKNFTYSGSNIIDEVAWYWKNAGDKTLDGFWSWSAIRNNHDKSQPVGVKKPNELGLYDMSGNVREWCFDWYGDSLENKSGAARVWRGGGWLGGEQSCEPSFRGRLEASGKGPDTGLRLCRSR